MPLVKFRFSLKRMIDVEDIGETVIERDGVSGPS